MNTYTPNPVVSAPNPATPPTPFTLDAAIAAGFYPADAAVNGTNPGLVTPLGGSALQGILTNYTDSNKLLIQAAVPGSQLWTVQWFLSPSVATANTPATTAYPNGNDLAWPAGSLFIRLAQDGASAVPVVAPPIAAPHVVLGVTRPLSVYTDGNEYQSCTAFNGTTLTPGKLLQYNGSNVTAENPGTVMPNPGDYVEVVQIYGGQAVVFLGPSPAGPIPVQQD